PGAHPSTSPRSRRHRRIQPDGQVDLVTATGAAAGREPAPVALDVQTIPATAGDALPVSGGLPRPLPIHGHQAHAGMTKAITERIASGSEAVSEPPQAGMLSAVNRGR